MDKSWKIALIIIDVSQVLSSLWFLDFNINRYECNVIKNIAIILLRVSFLESKLTNYAESLVSLKETHHLCWVWPRFLKEEQNSYRGWEKKKSKLWNLKLKTYVLCYGPMDFGGLDLK